MELTLPDPAAAISRAGPGPGERRPRPVPFLSWCRYPRWNFSRHAATFRAADGFVVSIQKSGRTWVRFFLTAYFAEWCRGNPRARTAPALVYAHDLWEHRAKERLGERLRGKWLLPRGEALRKPILLVARDPRDVMVSLFFHLQKRAGTFRGDLSALLRDPVFGVDRVVAIMNRWLAEWSGHTRLHLLHYEDARRDPLRTFAGALRFLLPGVALDHTALARAVDIASFDNMRRLEAGDRTAPGFALVGHLHQEALRPKDAGDPDSYKVRRGKVGGYVDYLSDVDLQYLNRTLERLDPRYRDWTAAAPSDLGGGHGGFRRTAGSADGSRQYRSL